MEAGEIDQIKSLLEGGYLDAARHRLEEMLKANQHDMQAWLLYVNSFKTMDARIEVLEICQRLNPGNLKVKNALEDFRKKKAAAQSTPPRPVTLPFQPTPAGQPSDRWDDQGFMENSSAEFTSSPQPSAGEESTPAWGYERSSKEMYNKPVSLSREEINRQARDYVEGRVKEKKIAGGPLAWYEVWITALTQPNVEAYDELRKNPYALPSCTYIWLIISGLISGLLVWISLGLNPQYDQALALVEADFPGMTQTLGAFMFCLVPLSGVMVLVNTAIQIGIQHLVARLMGGEGKYSEFLYLVAAYSAPEMIASSLLSLIPLVGSCLVAPLGMYGIYLNVQAIRSAHNLNSLKAWGVILGIFLFALIFICLFVYLGYSYIAPYLPMQPTF